MVLVRETLSPSLVSSTNALVDSSFLQYAFGLNKDPCFESKVERCNEWSRSSDFQYQGSSNVRR